MVLNDWASFGLRPEVFIHQVSFRWHSRPGLTIRKASSLRQPATLSSTAVCANSPSRRKLEQAGSSSAGLYCGVFLTYRELVQRVFRGLVGRNPVRGPHKRAHVRSADARPGGSGKLSERPAFCRSVGVNNREGNSVVSRLNFEVMKMATREVTSSSSAAQNVAAAAVTQNYSRPLAIVTTLFFMWGFLTCHERYSGAPSESNFRSELRASHAGAVCVLLGLLSVFRAMVEDRK